MITILLADDDPDDRKLVCDAFEENRVANPLRCVKDGQELMDYLHNVGEFSNPAENPRPGLILLDLNMPRKDGRAALNEIKADPELKRIPVVVLTTSQAELDVLSSYDSGANSVITKPVTITSLIEVVRLLGKYWLELVELPEQ